MLQVGKRTNGVRCNPAGIEAPALHWHVVIGIANRLSQPNQLQCREFFARQANERAPSDEYFQYSLLYEDRVSSFGAALGALDLRVEEIPGIQGDSLQHMVEGSRYLRRLDALDPDRREAFVLTQVLGFSYEEAGRLANCPIGTIRSRVARARADLLVQLRAIDDAEPHGRGQAQGSA